MFYRPHPKENLNHELFATIGFDNSSKDQLFQDMNILLDLTHFFFFEAFLKDAKCISLKLDEVYKSGSEEIPFSYAINARSLDLVRDALIKVKFDFPKREKKYFGGSKKCLEFLEKFLEESGYD